MCYQLSRFACGHIQNKRLRCNQSRTPFRFLNQIIFNDEGCNRLVDALHKNPDQCPACRHWVQQKVTGMKDPSASSTAKQAYQANGSNTQQPVHPSFSRANAVCLRASDYPIDRNSFDMMIAAHRDYNSVRENIPATHTVVSRPVSTRPPTAQSIASGPTFVDVALHDTPSQPRPVHVQDPTKRHQRSKSSKSSVRDRVLGQSPDLSDSSSSRQSGWSLASRFRLRSEPSHESFVCAMARDIEREDDQKSAKRSHR